MCIQLALSFSEYSIVIKHQRASKKKKKVWNQSPDMQCPCPSLIYCTVVLVSETLCRMLPALNSLRFTMSSFGLAVFAVQLVNAYFSILFSEKMFLADLHD